MTTFAEQMAADLDSLFDLEEFAVTVSYYNGSTSADVPAIIDYEAGKHNAKGATITVKKSDVAAPGYRHRFTESDGNVWYVAMENSRPLIKGDSLVWVIEVTRDERSDAWRT